MQSKKSVLLLAGYLLAVNPNIALSNENSPESDKRGRTLDSFLLEKEKGWYWYESLPEEEKEKVRKDIIDNAPNVIPKKQKNTPPEEQALSTAWFRENLPKYRDAAIDNPYDKEAMRTYLFLEKFMRDRATAFGYERQKAVYAEPFLDATSQRPLANFGMKEMNHQASAQRDQLLKRLGEESGIYFFYLSDCSFCEKQAPLVRGLEREFGFKVRAVSMNGKPMPNGYWPDYLTDQGQAQALGVAQVPATYLFNPKTQSVELIAQGLQSLPDLQKRIIYAAQRSGLITEDEAKTIRATGLYQNTEGFVGGGIPLPADAPKEFIKLYEQSVNQGQ